MLTIVSLFALIIILLVYIGIKGNDEELDERGRVIKTSAKRKQQKIIKIRGGIICFYFIFKNPIKYAIANVIQLFKEVSYLWQKHVLYYTC